MNPYYRLSLKKDSNTYFAVVNNAVIERTQPYYLENAPENWEAIGVKDERNMRMFGFVRSYTSEGFDFPLDGKQILLYAWLNYGNAGVVKFYVESLNTTTGLYELDFIADLALNTSSSALLKFTVKALETGVSAKIKSRENITYEIPVTTANGAETIDVLPYTVLGEYRFITQWPVRIAGTSTSSLATSAQMFKVAAYYVGRTIVAVSDTPDNEPVSNNPAANNNAITGQDFENMTGGGGYSNQYNYLFYANTAIKELIVKTTIPFYVANNSGTNSRFKLSISKMDSSGFQTNLYSVYSAVINAGTNSNFSLTLDNTASPATLAIGDALIIEATMETPAARNINVAWEQGKYINITFQHYTDSFQVKGIPWHKVWKKLIELITDGDATFVSNLLTVPMSFVDGIDLDPSMLYLLSGDSIRGISDAKIKVTLRDLFKSTFLMVGAASMGVEDNKVVVEKPQYFLDTTKEIADLGEVSDCVITPADDFVFNSLKIGYNSYDYDDLNGKDEPNTTQYYQLPLLTDKKECDWVSPIRADGLGIFYTWVNYALAPNKDNSSDNTLFALQAIRTGGVLRALYPKDISSSAQVSGVLEPTRLLNVGLTPKHLLIRNGSMLQSFFFSQENDYMKFQTTDKNYKLVTKITTSDYITENADIQIKKLGPRLFYPVYYNTKNESTPNYRQDWARNRNGYFSFTWQKQKLKGFPCISRAIYAVPKLEEFKLLAMTMPVTN